MELTGDDRGQSLQIGAVILFGALIILLSTYQAFVVPNQNREVEFKHSQAVQNDLQDMRSALVTASDGKRTSVSVQLGTEYPSRALFLNPGSPTGSLRTVGTENGSVNVTVRNATASGDAGDFWDGDPRNYSTGDIVYKPNYNEYGNAPRTVYSNTVLYNQFGGGNLTLSDQALVDGRSITLVALNGSLSKTQSGSVTVDIRAASASSTHVAVTNASDGENVTLEPATRLNESRWRSLLAEEMVDNGGHVYDVSVEPISDSEFDRLFVRLEPDVTYNLKLARVGVGSKVESADSASYLVKTRGNGTVVPEGENVTLEVQTRDSLNNPVSGETVGATTHLSDSDVTVTDRSDTDGRIELVYQSPVNVSESATDRVHVSLNESAVTAGSSFDSTTPINVTFTVSVDGSGSNGSSSAYEISYDTAQMNGQEGVSCSSGECTYDFGEDKTDSAFTFVTATSPTVMRANVDFALNSTSNGDYTSEDGETDGSGEAEAIFDADSTGGVKSYVSSGNSDDVQTVALVDTSKVISAFEPNTNDDTKYEFVRLYFTTAVDTTGWTLSDDEGSSQVTDLPAETLDGEVYFARDGAAFAEKWGLDKSRVYNMSTQLNNNGEPLWLNDSRGTVVDQVGYGGESPAGFDGSVSQPSQGQVANRTFVGGSYPYQDTNSDSDWALEGESDFFDTVASGGFTSQSVSDLVPSTSGQRQTFTFEPDQTIEGGTQVTINLTEVQQASPRQVDYRGSVASVSDGTATLNKKSADVAFLNWTAPSSDVAGGTTVRIVVEGVKTGPESNQNDPYSVDVTREDSGETTTGVFEVGRNTGGSELRNVAVTDLQENNSSQSQELVFEPTTDLDASQSISIDLSQAAGANDVDYTGASATVNASTSDLSFTDQTTDNASIRYTAPSGGLSADTPVKITVSGVSVGDGRRGEQRRHRRGPDVTMNARGRGQSTTVGNILLVGIIVVMTTTVSLGIVSNLTSGDGTFDDAAPQFDVRAEATGENITLGHNGGDSVAANRVLVVVANDTTERRFRVDLANLTGGDNRYDPGGHLPAGTWA